MNTCRDLVAQAVEAVQFTSRWQYAWFGRTDLPVHFAAGSGGEGNIAQIVYNLQQLLYENFYSVGIATPYVDRSKRRASAVVTPFVKELSRVNSGTGYWDEGWLITAFDQTRIVALKEGLTLYARRDECLSEPENTLAAGAHVSLRMPRERFFYHPGFYTAFGNRCLAGDHPGGIVRFYWNVTGQGAVRLMEIATVDFNAANVPFQMKVLKDETIAARADSVVIYVEGIYVQAVRSALERIHLRIANDLQDVVPVFTKRVAPGVGLAEEPWSGESFGQNRCRLLAQALVRAHGEGRTTLAARIETVSECFTEAGLSLDAPYLNPGSSDNYPSWLDVEGGGER